MRTLALRTPFLSLPSPNQTPKPTMAGRGSGTFNRILKFFTGRDRVSNSDEKVRLEMELTGLMQKFEEASNERLQAKEEIVSKLKTHALRSSARKGSQEGVAKYFSGTPPIFRKMENGVILRELEESIGRKEKVLTEMISLLQKGHGGLASAPPKLFEEANLLASKIDLGALEPAAAAGEGYDMRKIFETMWKIEALSNKSLQAQAEIVNLLSKEEKGSA